MKFEDKLKARSREDVWNEYCGFLDLSMDEFVQIQNRLMEEQIALWSRSPLGKKILKGSTPKNIKEFRGLVPLTSYDLQSSFYTSFVYNRGTQATSCYNYFCSLKDLGYDFNEFFHLFPIGSLVEWQSSFSKS